MTIFFKKAFSFFTLCVVLALCFSSAKLFSSYISIATIGSSQQSAMQESFSVYAISMYSSPNDSLANEQSVLNKKRGGAGCIYFADETHYVLASAYLNKADAENVEQNLNDSGEECTIVKLNFTKLEISATSNQQEKTALTNASKSFYALFEKLYDLSVSIDTKLLSQTSAKVELSKVISDFIETKTTFESLFNQKLTNSVLALKLSLNNTEKILEELSNTDDSEINFSSYVKNTYFKVLFEYELLTKSF